MCCRHSPAVRSVIKFSKISRGENGASSPPGGRVPRELPLIKRLSEGFSARTGAYRVKVQTFKTRSAQDAEKKWSTVGDWVATCLVCLMFIGMLSAMLVVLIGEPR